ncbi:universal stress protein UspA [Burkholderia stagnalis]|uniref:universal stress protein n=1 Tax=Burkholderia stagnalis TaxID=1503054 RepID=UPI00075F7EDF|nr:universal stress protein [Burkholderia stagnalis]KWK52387.1 universal stress protein UspA [Burkholderia stagnalis]KWK58860.1 universal stress protein UspA [Burkholderia stagnalis]
MYRKIMVAMDGSPSSKQALNEGLEVARLYGGHLDVVYVIDKSALLTLAGGYDLEALVAAMRRDGAAVLHSAEQAIEDASAAGDTKLIETRRIGEDIAGRLQRYVLENAIDLAVLGTHGRRGIERMLIGSVAERFLRGAICPVLFIRGEDPQPASTVIF